MIGFVCKCGHKFSEPEDKAGSTVQCPKCHLLADVPLLSDLPHLEEDGTFKIKPPIEPNKEADAQMERTFWAQRDQTGEYDLRVTDEQLLDAGTEEIPLALKDEVRPGPPKYDPETGVLIEPMALKPDKGKPPPAPAGPATLQYAKGEFGPPVPLYRVPFSLFSMASIVVMAIIFILHLLISLIGIPVAMGFIFMAFVVFFLILMVFAHYATVIEEIGVEGADELPTPLRGLSFGDDLFRPSVRFLFAMTVCYLPAVLGYAGPAPVVTALSLAGLGTFIFPALLLTLTTSGSLWNVRPDRIFGVIACCGLRYVLAILLWVLAFPIYVAAILKTGGYSIDLARSLASPGRITALDTITAIVAYPLLFGGIYLMHLWCVYLGMLYRRYHEQFPWVLQRHIPKPKVDVRPGAPLPPPPAPAAPRQVLPVDEEELRVREAMRAAAPPLPSAPRQAVPVSEDELRVREPIRVPGPPPAPRPAPRRVEPIRIAPAAKRPEEIPLKDDPDVIPLKGDLEEPK